MTNKLKKRALKLQFGDDYDGKLLWDTDIASYHEIMEFIQSRQRRQPSFSFNRSVHPFLL